MSGNSFRFGGTAADFISVDSVQIGNLDAFSISLFAKADSSSSEATLCLYSEGKSDSGTPYLSLEIDKTNSQLIFKLRDDASTAVTMSCGTGTFPLDTWNQAVVVQESKALRHVYVNGIRVLSDETTVGTLTLNQSSVGVFRGNGATSNPFLGEVEDFGLFKTPLSQEEIRNYYEWSTFTQSRYKPTFIPAPVRSNRPRLFRTSTLEAVTPFNGRKGDPRELLALDPAQCHVYIPTGRDGCIDKITAANLSYPFGYPPSRVTDLYPSMGRTPQPITTFYGYALLESPPSNLGAMSSFTISAMVFYDNTQTTIGYLWCENTSATTNYAQGMYFDPVTGSVTVFAQGYTDIVSIPGVVTPNKWHHLCLTVGPITNNRKIFVNGRLVGSGSMGPYNSGAATYWGIRRYRNGTTGGRINGGISDIFVYKQPWKETDIKKYADWMLGQQEAFQTSKVLLNMPLLREQTRLVFEDRLKLQYVNITRKFPSTLTAADVVRRGINVKHFIHNPALVLSDIQKRGFVLSPPVHANSITISDVTKGTRQFNKKLMNPMTLTETCHKAWDRHFHNPLDIHDNWTRVHNRSSCMEDLTVTDTLVRYRTTRNAKISETMSMYGDAGEESSKPSASPSAGKCGYVTVTLLGIGGGGGGGGTAGGGGGGGDVRETTKLVRMNTYYEVTVGGGGRGSGQGAFLNYGWNGEDTIVIGVHALGGGAGTDSIPGNNGGQGGGGGGVGQNNPGGLAVGYMAGLGRIASPNDPPYTGGTGIFVEGGTFDPGYGGSGSGLANPGRDGTHGGAIAMSGILLAGIDPGIGNGPYYESEGLAWAESGNGGSLWTYNQDGFPATGTSYERVHDGCGYGGHGDCGGYLVQNDPHGGTGIAWIILKFQQFGGQAPPSSRSKKYGWWTGGVSGVPTPSWETDTTLQKQRVHQYNHIQSYDWRDEVQYFIILGEGFSESLTLNSTVKRPSVRTRALPTDNTLSVSDTVRVGRNYTHKHANPITISDSKVELSWNVAHPPFHYTLEISDVLHRHRETIVAEALTLLDTMVSANTITASPISESLTISDFVGQEYSRTVAETLAVTDELRRQITRDYGIVESISISSAQDPSVNITGRASSSLSVADAVARSFTLDRTLASSISVTDLLLRDRLGSKAVAESVSITDAIDYLFARIEYITESLTVSDYYDPITSHLEDFVMHLGIGELTDRSVVFGRSSSETLTVSDTVSASVVLSRKVAESVSVNDQLDRALVLGRKSTNAMEVNSPAPIISREFPFLELFSNFSDSLTRKHISNPKFGNSLSMSDDVVASKTFGRSFIEPMSMGSYATPQLDKYSTMSEPLILSDAVSWDYSVANKSFMEALAVGDRLTARNPDECEFSGLSKYYLAVFLDPELRNNIIRVNDLNNSFNIQNTIKDTVYISQNLFLELEPIRVYAATGTAINFSLMRSIFMFTNRYGTALRLENTLRETAFLSFDARYSLVEYTRLFTAKTLQFNLEESLDTTVIDMEYQMTLDGYDCTQKVASCTITYSLDSFCAEVDIDWVGYDEWRDGTSLYDSVDCSDISRNFEIERFAVYTRIKGATSWKLQGKFFLEKRDYTVTYDKVSLSSWGRNRPARLSLPYAKPITKEWTTDTTAKAIAQELCDAKSVTLSWEVADFKVLGSNLDVETTEPVDIVSQLAAVVGGVLTCTKSGTLRVIYRYSDSTEGAGTEYVPDAPEIVDVVAGDGRATVTLV